MVIISLLVPLCLARTSEAPVLHCAQRRISMLILLLLRKAMQWGEGEGGRHATYLLFKALKFHRLGCVIVLQPEQGNNNKIV